MSTADSNDETQRSFAAAMAWLGTFTDWEQLKPAKNSAPAGAGCFGLQRIQHLLRALGNPEMQRPCLHITGTKGKSSTACYAAAILQAHGVKVFRYLSPHVERVHERLQLNGSDIGDADFAALADQLRGPVEAVRTQQPELLPTFFEATTAMGFLHALHADCSVLEVGLGGRLDATNVVRPVAAVITSIGLDHTQLLGSTRAQVAAEKAGIIKASTPVLIGLTNADAGFSTIAGTAAALLAPLLHAGDHFRVSRCEYFTFDDGAPGLRFDGVAAGIALKGVELQAGSEHQAMNALLAIGGAALMLAHLGKRFDVDAARNALRSAKLPARAEWFPPREGANTAPVLLDGAHTAESVEAVLQVAQRLAAGRPVHALVGLTAERGPATVFAALRACQSITATTIPGPRALPAAQLAAALEASLRTPAIHTVPAPLDALRHAQTQSAGGLLLVVGSLYLAGALRSSLIGQGAHPLS